MPAWIWFVVAVAVGVLLLTAATLADRHTRRKVTGADEPAPLRRNESVDRHVPAYLTQDEVDAMTHPAESHTADLPHRGEGFGFGHAHPDFASNPDGASWANPRVLVVDGEVRSMRELISPLSTATAESPLAVVAGAIHPWS